MEYNFQLQINDPPFYVYQENDETLKNKQFGNYS